MQNVKDDIIYGKELLSPRVVEVKPLDDYKLELRFDNGELRLFDATPLLEYPAFAQLKSKAFFNSVSVSFGTITWPGDIDYCPDTLYEQSSANV